MMLTRTLFALVGTVAIGIGAASADMVLIDLGNGQGTPTAPDANGSYWNQLATIGSALSLLSSTDGTTDTGWDLEASGAGDTTTGFTGGGLDAIAEGAPADFAVDGAYDDGYYDNGFNSPGTFTFSGLDSGQTYTLRLWGSRRTTSGGDAGTGADIEVTAGSAAGGPTFLLTLPNLMTLNVTPDAGGNFAFTFDKATADGITGLNVMSLEVVPEPASAALVGLGVLLILSRRRQTLN